MTASPSSGAALFDGSFNLAALEKPMPQIGTFTREKSCFFGRIETLVIRRDIVLVPTENADGENTPNAALHGNAPASARANSSR